MLKLQKQKKLILFFTLIFLFTAIMPSAFASGSEKVNLFYYVSLDGNDTNPGTIDKPFATVEKARDTIRELKETSGLPSGSITVYIRGGLYERKTTFLLTAEDAGNENCVITYSAYPNEEVVFSMGYRIPTSEFQLVSDKKMLERLPYGAKKNVLAYNLKVNGITDWNHLSQAGNGLWNEEDTMYGMQVFAGSQTYDLARWPNRDKQWMPQFVKTVALIKNNDAYSVGANADVISTYTVNQDTMDRVKTWKNVDNVWVEGSFNWVYFVASLPVDSVDFATRQISTRGAGYSGFLADRPFFFFNVIEELDNPGEYYIDRDNGVLYLYPESEFEKSEYVTLSGYGDEYILRLLDGANYININGITFEGTQRHCAQVYKCSYVNVTNCNFKSSAGSGLFVGEEAGCHSDTSSRLNPDDTAGVDLLTHNNNVVNCNFINLGNGGVRVVGGSTHSLTPGNSNIINCYSNNISYTSKTYSPAYQIWGCENNLINNVAENLTHSAVNFAGNDLILANNECANVLQEYSDMGAIYTAWNNIDNYYINNYIHDVRNVNHASAGDGSYLRWLNSEEFIEHKVGLYVDGAATGGYFYGNVIENVPTGLRFMGTEINYKGNLHIDTRLANMTGKFNGEGRKAYNATGEWTNSSHIATNSWNQIAEAPAWQEKKPFWANYRDEMTKKIKERGEEALINANHFEENVYMYDRLIDKYEDYYMFGDSAIFNGFDYLQRKSWVRMISDPVLPTLNVNGSFKNNLMTTNDIGFEDYKNKDFTVKEDAQILKTQPYLKYIQSKENGNIEKEDLKRVLGDSTVFMTGSSKAILNGQTYVSDDIEALTKEENGKLYIEKSLAKKVLSADYDDKWVCLDDIAAASGKNLYKYDNGVVIISEEKPFDAELNIDNTYGFALYHVLEASLR